MSLYRTLLIPPIRNTVYHAINPRIASHLIVLPSSRIVLNMSPLWINNVCCRNFSSSRIQEGKDSTRKMIKDKKVRKDPALRALAQSMLGKRNPLAKLDNKKVIKRRKVNVWDQMTLRELSSETDMDLEDLFEVVISLNVNTDWLESEDQPIKNNKVFRELAKKLDFTLNMVSNPNEKKKEKTIVDRDARRSPPPEETSLVPRPPVVTIMGHIDHGKTSLLDYLRKSRIVAGEAGGITQHIGAFSVKLPGMDKKVTVIDTPGHAAFTAMRTRGASSTDIVILIVDSCEGVLDQTKESLRIIRQTRVPFVVALNKIDKPESDVDAVKKQLKEEGVLLEEFGGDVQCVPISALKGTNVRQLIEAVLTQAEVLELRGDPKGKSEGVVIEGQVEHGLGKTATVLVQRGVVRVGSFLVCGHTWCKVRLLLNDQGEKMKELKISEAGKVVGWRGETVPGAGEEVLAVESETRAREVVAWRAQQELKRQGEMQSGLIEEQRKANREVYLEYRTKKRESGWIKPRYGTLDFHKRVKESAEPSLTPVVGVVIKCDVDGSLEAILAVLETYCSEEVKLDIVHFGVGQVSETDISLAESFGAIVYAFNTSITDVVQRQANTALVPVKRFDVIYHLIGDLKSEISLKLPPLEVEDIVGRANVLQHFTITEKKAKVPVAGCRVISGRFPRNGNYRISRGDQVIFEGGLASLKHHKDEVGEIHQNQECGLRPEVGEGQEAIIFEAGDTIVCFTTRMEAATCNWNPGF